MTSRLGTLLIVGLGVLSFWLWRLLDEEIQPPPEAKLHEPDYYLLEMVRTTMDEHGGVQSVLEADTVYHFPDDDSTELGQPRMRIYNNADEPWHVIAERGTVHADNEIILLHGQVEIWRPDKNGVRELEVLTSELRVFPKVQYAETDEVAVIKSSSSVTNSIGFRANFEHDRLELLEQVKSRYETNTRS